MKKFFTSGLFWTLFLGIVSIAVAVLLYTFSQESRKPVYIVKNEPRIIFDENRSSPSIRVLANDSVLVNKNVYVTNLVVWNDGNVEIKKEDVRKSILIEPSANSEILDFQIVKETHSSISDFNLIPKGRKLLLEWDYFDPDFAFEVQLIYSGKDNTSPRITGHVFGNSVKRIKKNEISEMQVMLIFLISMVIVFVPFTGLGFIYDKKVREGKWTLLKKIETPLILVCMVGALFLMYYCGVFLSNFYETKFPLM